MKLKTSFTLIWCAIAVAACLDCSSRYDGVLEGRATPELVEGGALFRYHDPGAKRVYLVGDFNSWTQYSDPMRDPQGDGNWELFFPLTAGSYAYKLVVDGRWIPDPRNPLSEPDGFGGRNSIAKIPELSPGS